MFSQHHPIILASSSPRRKSMLNDLGLNFKSLPAMIDETPRPDETPERFASRMAQEKAQYVARDHLDCIIIGADTVVAMGETIFGKPTSPEEALHILQTLRNRTHTVITGVAIIFDQIGIREVFYARTKVRFANFPDPVLQAYIDSNDPMDKAGAYGIQSVGGFLVHSIEGSYSNVVGLPICELMSNLLRLKLVDGE